MWAKEQKWESWFVVFDGGIDLFSDLFLTALDKEGVICSRTVLMKDEPREDVKVMSSLPREDLNHSVESCTKMTMQLRRSHSRAQFVRT